jgi:uncharacterized membrane protein
MRIIKTLALVIFFFIATIFSSFTQAQEGTLDEQPFEETLEGIIVEVLEEKEVGVGDERHLYQRLKVSITKGSLKDQSIVVKNGEFEFANIPDYKKGDKLVISYTKDFEGNDLFYIADYVRRSALLGLFIIFIILAVLVGKVWGITSILGMGFSFLVIFKFILPQIINGANPVLIAIIGSVFIIPVTFYLSHGFNNKTHIAIAGTIVALIITGVLAVIFVEVSNLTGFASEEAGFLQFEKQGLINMKGLLLAGIIVGTLGILDDVTVSQSAIVFQLKEANKQLKFSRLYNQAMKVGHDHISSMVNTLVLVYTGAAMPLLLLFVNNPRPFSELINYEIIADEIVRTLVGSIGLVLAVPITTFLAAYYFSKE